MARQTKTKTEQTETAPAQTAPPATTTEQKVAKAPKEKKSPSSTTTAPVAPSVVEPVATQPTTEEPAEASSSDLLAKSSADFYDRLNKWVAEGNSLKAEFKSLEKRWSRELKTAMKSKKRTKRGGNRSSSVFIKPVKISDELALFFEKPVGSEMARTEVTKEINNYIRTHNLQDKENGRKIIPDAKLTKLLKIEKGQELTYFNLQRYMSPHFPKTPKETTA